MRLEFEIYLFSNALKAVVARKQFLFVEQQMEQLFQPTPTFYFVTITATSRFV